MARVTVCIPTYKRVQWLGATIASALGQTFTDLVVEVHDDATPDGSVEEVVAGFDDPRLRYVRWDANAGIVGNFTRSLLGASSEYVIQLGDDDIAAPSLVARTVAALDAHPRAGVAHSRFALIDAAGAVMMASQDWLGTPSPSLEPGPDFVSRSMVHGCRVCSSTALIRRAAVPEGGFLQARRAAVRLRLLAADGRALGRRVRRRGALPVPDPRAELHVSGLSDVTGTGYLQAEKTLREVHAVKRRHAARGRLAASSRGWPTARCARTSSRRVRERTLPDRPFVATFRGLGDAARREPGLLLEPHAWKLLAGSVVGPARGASGYSVVRRTWKASA